MNLAKKQDEQKAELLRRGRYNIVPHEYLRNLMPDLAKKHGGRTGRDAVILYLLLLTYVNGDKKNFRCGWAWPSNEEIVKITRIDKNRVKDLFDILINEGLIVLEKVPMKYGAKKNFYLPLYPDHSKVNVN